MESNTPSSKTPQVAKNEPAGICLAFLHCAFSNVPSNGLLSITVPLDQLLLLLLRFNTPTIHRCNIHMYSYIYIYTYTYIYTYVFLSLLFLFLSQSHIFGTNVLGARNTRLLDLTFNGQIQTTSTKCKNVFIRKI